jgi:hypothetical protein
MEYAIGLTGFIIFVGLFLGALALVLQLFCRPL